MSNQTIYIIMGVAAGAFVLIVLAYYILSKKMQKSEYKKIQKLQQGTKQKSFSMEILYQKLYVYYVKIPFLKRYILKLRRRLEIINIDDEYNTRKDASRILTKSLAIIIPIIMINTTIIQNHHLSYSAFFFFSSSIINTSPFI